MEKVKVAIVGASGYSGEELLRLLLNHPWVELACLTSRQYAEQPVGHVFPRFAESELRFSAPNADAIAGTSSVAFLALPHGLAADYAVPLLDAGVRVIDISADFRLHDPKAYTAYYGTEHPAPRLLDVAVYGLPERYRSELHDARLVACPGCYPTSIVLATAPLLARGMLSPTGISAVSLSGVSGAGRKVDLPYIFPECNESIRPYAPVGHRHLPEIEQELAIAADVESLTMNFVPHLIPVNRGIHSTVLADVKTGVTSEDLWQALNETYAREPFVRVLPPGKLADTKNVTFTNMCEIGCVIDDRTGRAILSSAIDNLTKGAAGQAIQCMNVACGFAEDAGLPKQ